ncbi:hypothetical protein FACS189491_11460 [Spirochaetia bacterium]|nr:hypothetical protein FACS189491_11460 [Spirochaetia bacterium]
MVKKAVLSLVLLTVLGAAVFAEYYNGYEYTCYYEESNQGSTDFFKEAEEFAKERPDLRRNLKLPNSVHQVISHALEDYTLDVGDIFVIRIEGRDNILYGVMVRITNKNGTYEFAAFSSR